MRGGFGLLGWIVVGAWWLIQKGWKALDNYFTLTDLLELLGWKVGIPTVGVDVLTAVWAHSTEAEAPVVFVLGFFAAVLVLFASVCLDMKRAVRTGAIITKAEAEGRAEARRTAEKVHEERQTRRRDLVRSVTLLFAKGRSLEESVKAVPAAPQRPTLRRPGVVEAERRREIVNADIDSWVREVTFTLRPEEPFENQFFTQPMAGGVEAITRYFEHMNRLNDILGRLNAKLG
jgi:hypothetical protein